MRRNPKRSRNKLLSLLRCGLVLMFATNAATAAPISYKLTFDGSVSGTAGTGSFVRDDVTETISAFQWDFGPGKTGGIMDALFDGFQSQLYYFMLISINADPNTEGYTINSPEPFLLGPFGEDGDASFCWGISSDRCFMPNPGIALASYFLQDTPADGGPSTASSGYVRAARATSVPEPTTAMLLAIGMLGILCFGGRTTSKPATLK